MWPKRLPISLLVTLKEQKMAQYAIEHQTASDPARILSLREWYGLCGFSDATGRKILNTGKGPRVVQLSERRRGIALADNLAWIQANSVLPSPVTTGA